VDTLNRFLPLLTLVMGGGLAAIVLKVWDRLHPETRVRYRVRTSGIPLPTTPNLPFDTFSEITVRNPSRRVKATNVGIAILVPTDRPMQVGEVGTPEPTGSIVLSQAQRILGGSADYMRLELRADRLAPGSHITVPVWYLASGHELRVEGTTDQAVLASADETDSTSSVASQAWPMLAGMVTALTLGLLSYTYWQARADRSPLQVMAHVARTPDAPRTGRSGSEVAVLPTAPPATPRLTLVNPNTVNVDSDPQSAYTSLELAEAEGGEFRGLASLRPDQRVVRLASPHAQLWLRAYSWNRYGDSRRSSVLHVPASVAPPEPIAAR
jgi:hypothetical protein